MPYVRYWVFAALGLGVAGSFAVGLILHTVYAVLFYAPYAALLAEWIRQIRRVARGHCYAVYSGAEYPWGSLVDVYAVRREAERVAARRGLATHYVRECGEP